MRRQLDRQHSDIAFQGYLPGCVWSALHILDYHYWHSNKRISSRRKHRRGKHTICFGYPKTVSFEHYRDEAHEYLDSDAVPLMAEHGTVNADPTARTSGKDRIKALVAKEMSARSQMQRADSISPLRSSDNLGGTTDWSNPIIIVEKSADNLVNAYQNYSDAKKLTREISQRQIMECVDVLEIFKINKKLFLDVLQDPDAKPAKTFDIQLTSDMKVKFKKSGSFPIANPPDNRHLRPSTLEHKWRETWLLRKGEKFNSEVELPQYISSKSLEDFYNKEINDIKADDAGGLAVNQESGFSSSPSSQGPNKHGWHQSFMNHLKDMMKKIKHTLKESKKQNNQLSADEKEISRNLEEVTIHQDGKENSESYETSSSDNNLSNDRLSHIRRVSSLNESLDRYARLFDYSLTRGANWHDHNSKSLRLINEDEIPPTGSRIRTFKRRLSLPDLDSFSPSPNETSNETLHSEMSSENVRDYDITTKKQSHNELSTARTPFDREQFDLLDAVEESELQRNMEEGGSADFVLRLREEITNTREHEGAVEPEKQNHGTGQDQKIVCRKSLTREHEKQNHGSVLETHIEDHITGPRKVPVSEGSELDNWHISVDEIKPSVDLDHENDDNADTMTANANNFLQSEIKEPDDADFNYVRDVLEVSGLIQQGHLGTWHSLDQPLSPTLFKELEVYLHQELACSSEDVDYNCDHRLLFDLINEALLQIYESSLAYFPKPFSLTQRVRPLPKGSHILEEVWKRIQSPKLRMDYSLNDIMARDLSKEDGWMNLQLDVEDIALDLEDLMFDELLDEVIYS